MLELLASHLRLQGPQEKKLIWVDIGGGSGWNIEEMDKFMSISSSFEKVYLLVSLQLYCLHLIVFVLISSHVIQCRSLCSSVARGKEEVRCKGLDERCLLASGCKVSNRL